MDIFKVEPGPALSQVFDLNPVATLIIEQATEKVIAINEAGVNMFQLNDFNFSNTVESDIFIWQDSYQKALAYKLRAKQGGLRDFYASIRDRFGKRIKCNLTYQPCFYLETPSFLVFIDDKSEIARLQGEVFIANDLAESFTKSSKVDNWKFSPKDGLMYFCSFVNKQLYGTDQSEGYPVRLIEENFVHAIDIDKWRKFIKELEGPHSFQCQCCLRLKLKSGIFLWYRLIAESNKHQFDADGFVSGRLVLMHPLKNISWEQAINLEMLNLASKEAQIGVWQVMPDSESIWNDINYLIYGYEPPCPISIREICRRAFNADEEARIKAWMGTLFVAGEITGSSIQHLIKMPDGSMKWLRSHGKRYRDPETGGFYLLGITIDINDEQLLKEELLKNQEDLRRLGQHQIEVTRLLREKLAIDLHDCLSQSITLLRWSIDKLVRHAETSSPSNTFFVQNKSEIDSVFNEILFQLRTALQDLHPHFLKNMGLQTALKQECDQLNSRGFLLNINFIVNALEHECNSLNNAIRYPGEVEYAFYMIAREAITNAIKHSGGKDVWVTLTTTAGAIKLSVSDNGRGLPPEYFKVGGLAGGTQGHVGLVGIREHSRAIAADLEIGNTPLGGMQLVMNWQEPKINLSLAKEKRGRRGGGGGEVWHKKASYHKLMFLSKTSSIFSVSCAEP